MLPRARGHVRQAEHARSRICSASASILWETLTGERLFDGKTDVEIFKKIRACKVPPIARAPPRHPAGARRGARRRARCRSGEPLRDRRPSSLTRSSQVMKQAVGIDPASALGAAVRELKATGKAGVGTAPTSDYDLSRADADADPIPLTTKKTKPPI